MRNGLDEKMRLIALTLLALLLSPLPFSPPPALAEEKNLLELWEGIEAPPVVAVAVVYSLTSRGAPQTILPGVQPVGEAPVVQSGVDKFYKTELETILRERKVKTVVIVGTASEGAVLHTATGAALRGFEVVVPLDGMTSATLYAEQYTAWHLLNAPGTKGKVTLTLFGLLGF
jgi:hypothetical protein